MRCTLICQRIVRTADDKVGGERFKRRNVYELITYSSSPVGGSTSCVPRSRNCISCVLRWPLHVHQLRPAVRKELYQLRPGLSTPNMVRCVPQLVRNCISCIVRLGCTDVQQVEGSYSFIVLYFILNYTHTCRIVEWYRQHSYYIMLLSNV